MLELSCTSWILIFIVVGVISFLVTLRARIQRDGLKSSSEVIIGKYPHE